jgi:N-carbamoyl-L-amino-acid hydrolase
MPPAALDGPRLLDRLDALALDGAGPDGRGVTRLAWSPVYLRARQRLADWATESGLNPVVDAVGNLVVELPGGVPGLPPLSTGSHLDSVVDGGALDGAYGAVAAFEVAATLASAGERLRHPLRAVAWVNEEGVVAPAFTGSLAAAGGPIDLAARGPDDVPLADRIREAGGSPELIGGAAWGPLAGYLELHIEQGPVLDQADLPIGVVTGITGCRRGWITFEGRSGHAGTTPMGDRRDAALAAAHAVLAVDALARRGLLDVATAGAVTVLPGNANVIAGHAEVSFDLRCLEDERNDAALAALRTEVDAIAAATGTTADVRVTSDSRAVRTDPGLRATIAEAASALGLATAELASGAGHDAQHLTNLGPVGMLFVPSAGGVSHHPDERTEPEQLVAGASVLLEALRLADRRLDPR